MDLKRILSIVLCSILILAALPSCAQAETEAEKVRHNYVILDGFVYNVTEKTTADEFLAHTEAFRSVEAKGEYLKTGDIATDNDGNKYSVVIYGDVSANGVIDKYDYIAVKRLYMQTVTLSGATLEAAKKEENVTVYDYIRIKRHVMKTADIASSPHRTDPKFNNVKIAYIPLDNRPVNKERVEYLAASAGFTLLIPEESLYRTALDNMTPNPDGSTIGNRVALLEWLKSVEDECDYFVISLDQLISGGLVGSRYLSNTDLKFEMEVADYLIRLAEKKHLILFDTVMRLASTVGYQGYEMDAYNALRSYGKKARKTLKGDQLTVDNIIAGYRYDENGREISVSVSDGMLDQYLASRARKLKVIDHLLSNAVDDIERIYIGVDDSSPETTIQTNEINYITSVGGENLTLFAGADELGLMGIAAVATDVYGEAECKVTYFGEGKNWAADGFDTSTLADCIEKHFSSIGATLDSDNKYALQVLVLTRSDNVKNNADALMKQAVKNISEGIPTCIIDASSSNRDLPYMVIDRQYDMAKLLGYSNWNTVANATGISLSNAVARYVYIKNAPVTEESNKAFLKTLTFSFIKDISYKNKGITNLKDTSQYGPVKILERINSSEMLVGINETAPHGKVSVSNFRYPWNRSFEATFDIKVE